MTEITPAAPAELVACAHCGALDSGTYCSTCGKELAPTDKHVLAEAWEAVVTDRLNDVRAYATTTWWMVARPARFFRTALGGPAQRAGHVFPAPVPDALPRGTLQSPVKFLILSFVVSILAGKLAGEQATAVIPGLEEDLNNEITLLVIMGFIGFYALGFHRAANRRVSPEETAVFMAYLTGANLLLVGVTHLTPPSWGFALFAQSVLAFYVSMVIPYRVLPRLYAMTRRRVLLAQMGGFVASITLMLVAVGIVMGIAGALRMVLA